MHLPRVPFVDETAALVVLARRGELATAAVAVPALVVEIEVQVLREADPLHASSPLSSQNAVAELVDLDGHLCPSRIEALAAKVTLRLAAQPLDGCLALALR